MPRFRMREDCASSTGCGENSLGRGSRIFEPGSAGAGAPERGGRRAHLPSPVDLLPSPPELSWLGRKRRLMLGQVQGLPGTPSFSRIFL